MEPERSGNLSQGPLGIAPGRPLAIGLWLMRDAGDIQGQRGDVARQTNDIDRSRHSSDAVFS
jgi:hypothetical protein